MPFTVAMCTDFKASILAKEQDVTTDTIKLALYTSNADLGPDTLFYTTDNEVSGAGYTAGGITVTGGNIWTDGTTAGFSFDNPIFGTMTVSGIRVGLFYNASVSNRAIGVIAFGSPVTCSNQGLEVELGANTSATGLFRLMG